MGHYLDGEDNKVFVKMYKGRAIGLSFPTDGNRHYDAWAQRKYPIIVDGKESELIINTYEDGVLISIEIDLPENIIKLDTSIS